MVRLPGTAVARTLVGREAELATVTRLLDEVPAHGARLPVRHTAAAPVGRDHLVQDAAVLGRQREVR